MAHSGSVVTTKFEYSSTVHIGLRCDWEIASQSIESNSTIIHWTLTSDGAAGFEFYTGNVALDFNGDVVYSHPDRFLMKGGGEWSVSGTTVVEHDDDGKKNLTISLVAGIWEYGTASYSGSDTFELTPIMRGQVHIDNGEAIAAYIGYIDNGTSWDMCIPQIDNGTSWDLYS